jgi:hypothetical protein
MIFIQEKRKIIALIEKLIKYLIERIYFYWFHNILSILNSFYEKLLFDKYQSKYKNVNQRNNQNKFKI